MLSEDPVDILNTDLKRRLSGGGEREGGGLQDGVEECLKYRTVRVLGISLAFSNQQ